MTVDGTNNSINIPDTITTAVAFGALTFDADAPAGANQLSINTTGGGMGQTATFTGTSLSGGPNTLTINDMNTVSPGVISGSGGLTVDGNGTILLSEANTFTGVLTVDGAVAQVSNNAGLGAAGAGNETNVLSGGSVQISGGIDNVAEIFTIVGAGNSKSQGALHHVSGDSDNFTGQITLSGDAEIFSGNNRWRLQGGINMGANDLTFRVNGGNIEIRNNPIAGSGEIIKEGNGRVDMFNGANNTFTGAVRINDGELDVRDNESLGAAGGGTFVANGATLTVRDGRTLPESNIQITGNGHNNRGAIRNENNNNTLSGTVTLNGNSRIHVNPGSLTIGTLTESGSRNLEVTGNGALNLNGGSGVSGAVTVNGGATLGIGSTAMANNASSFNLSNNSSLHINGTGGNVTTPISLAGGGVTSNATGNLNITTPLNSSNGHLAIGNTSAGTTLTTAIASLGQRRGRHVQRRGRHCRQRRLRQRQRCVVCRDPQYVDPRRVFTSTTTISP